MIDEFLAEIQTNKISVDQAKKDPSPDLFVMNTCDMNGLKQKGELILNIFIDSKRHSIRIPDTWLPWELSHYVSKKQWLADIEFIKLIRRGVVTLIDPEVARQILEEPEGKAEYEKLITRSEEIERGAMLQSDRIDEMVRTRQNQELVANAIDSNKKSTAQPSPIVNKGAQEAPNIKIVSIINNRDLEEVSKINALRNMQRSLTPNDIKWIISNCKKEETKLKEWALSLRHSK